LDIVKFVFFLGCLAGFLVGLIVGMAILFTAINYLDSRESSTKRVSTSDESE